MAKSVLMASAISVVKIFRFCHASPGENDSRHMLRREILPHDFIFSFKENIIREIAGIAESLRGRDSYIQNIMLIVEEKCTKLWDIPWPLIRIVHEYTWKWEDLWRISSKVQCLTPTNAYTFRISFCTEYQTQD